MQMNWKNLLSTQRFRTKNGEIIPTVTPSTQEGADALRTDFHIDYDRVVFSGAFRRLGRKAQVHPLAEHDLTHSRLTHSVEVASVGRSIGNRVGVMLQAGGFLPENNTPSDIGAVVQVACLAHDLGNPPFGHTGEDALRDWFRNPEHAGYLKNVGSRRQYLATRRVLGQRAVGGRARFRPARRTGCARLQRQPRCGRQGFVCWPSSWVFRSESAAGGNRMTG